MLSVEPPYLSPDCRSDEFVSVLAGRAPFRAPPPAPRSPHPNPATSSATKPGTTSPNPREREGDSYAGHQPATPPLPPAGFPVHRPTSPPESHRSAAATTLRQADT